MKLIASPLQLKKFHLIQYEFKFNAGVNSKVLKIREEVFPKYLIDVDFAWQKNEDEQLVFCKLEINRGNNKQAGYSIMVEGVGIFEMGSNITESDRMGLISYSGPSIVLQELRALIRNNTFIAPFGPYVLPTVNIQPQIKEKMEKFRSKKIAGKKAAAKKK